MVFQFYFFGYDAHPRRPDSSSDTARTRKQRPIRCFWTKVQILPSSIILVLLIWINLITVLRQTGDNPCDLSSKVSSWNFTQFPIELFSCHNIDLHLGEVNHCKCQEARILSAWKRSEVIPSSQCTNFGIFWRSTYCLWTLAKKRQRIFSWLLSRVPQWLHVLKSGEKDWLRVARQEIMHAFGFHSSPPPHTWFALTMQIIFLRWVQKNVIQRAKQLFTYHLLCFR